MGKEEGGSGDVADNDAEAVGAQQAL